MGSIIAYGQPALGMGGEVIHQGAQFVQVMIGLPFPVAMRDAMNDDRLFDFRPEFQRQVETAARVPKIFTPVEGDGTIHPQSIVSIDQFDKLLVKRFFAKCVVILSQRIPFDVMGKIFVHHPFGALD